MVGHVGAGKSSFISALLGELEVQRGTVTMKVRLLADTHLERGILIA